MSNRKFAEIKIKVEQIEYHRNGISGEPFYVVLFRDLTEGDNSQVKVATVFEASKHVAVLGLDGLNEGNIGMGNKWRGDNYEPLFRKVIEGVNSPSF